VALDADGYRSGAMNEKLTGNDIVLLESLTLKS